MLNRLSFSIIFCFIFHPAFSQGNLIRKNSIYLEIFGNSGSVASLNYERIIKLNKENNLFLCNRLGFSFHDSKYDKKIILCFPLEISILLGAHSHYAEFGVGYTTCLGTSSLKDPIIPDNYKTNYFYEYILRIGYRCQFKTGALVRIAPTLMFYPDPPVSKTVVNSLFFGFSLGYNF